MVIINIHFFTASNIISAHSYVCSNSLLYSTDVRYYWCLKPNRSRFRSSKKKKYRFVYFFLLRFLYASREGLCYQPRRCCLTVLMDVVRSRLIFHRRLGDHKRDLWIFFQPVRYAFYMCRLLIGFPFWSALLSGNVGVFIFDSRLAYTIEPAKMPWDKISRLHNEFVLFTVFVWY